MGPATELVAVVDCEPEDEPLLGRLRREVPTRVAFGDNVLVFLAGRPRNVIPRAGTLVA